MYPIAENSQVKGRVQTSLGRNGAGKYVVEQIIDGFSVFHAEFEPSEVRNGQGLTPPAQAMTCYEERISHARRYLYESVNA